MPPVEYRDKDEVAGPVKFPALEETEHLRRPHQ
jgi:hypothetical protein